jgi:hypothetical protein
MNLRVDESVLTGSWIIVDGSISGDSVCKRIEKLISSHLKKVASSPQWGDWETLYQDPVDGRYWERTYPHGELQGGGAPQLKVLSADEARLKYGVQDP